MSRSDRKPYHHGNLKRALLEAARSLVETEGRDALTCRRLARTVEVSHAAPLAHFPDRTSLHAALATEGFQELAEVLEKEEPRPSFRAPTPAEPLRMASQFGPSVALVPRPSRRLIAAAVAYLRFALEHPGLYRVMYGPDLSDELRKVDPAADPRNPLVGLLQEKSRAFGVFVELVREGQRAGGFRKDVPADQAARLFMALAEGLAHQYLEEKAPDPTRLQHAERLFELLISAIESGPGNR